MQSKLKFVEQFYFHLYRINKEQREVDFMERKNNEKWKKHNDPIYSRSVTDMLPAILFEIFLFSVLNLLKPTGYVMHQQFNIQQL